MSRHTQHEHDEDDDDSYDAERDYDPDDLETYPEGLYDDDGPPVVPCRSCGKEMFEDTDECPHCGTYQSMEDATQQPRYGPGIIVVILALILAIFMAFG